MNRDHYQAGVVSVTELLHWWARLYPKLWPKYPDEPTGYYKRRGDYLDQCCAIIAQGKELDDRTMAMLMEVRRKPLVKDDAPEDRKYERWWDFVWPFRQWCQESGVVYIASQVYVISKIGGVQGTYDLKCLARLKNWDEPKLCRLDFKSGTCPKGTRFQLALYDLCDERTERIGMQLRPGKCTPHEYTDYRDYATAQMMVQFYNRMGEYK